MTALDYIASVTATVEPVGTDFEDRMRAYGLDPKLAVVRAGIITEYKGNVYLSDKGLKKLPFKFVKVLGYFYCDGNQLTSLAGCPKYVGADFNCAHNLLASLKGCPQNVTKGFKCSYNALKSLVWSPEKVDGSFLCDHNALKSLAGSPSVVKGIFACDFNEITTLEGGPKAVGSFYVRNNRLHSLSGAPKVAGSLYCRNNPGIDSFKKPANVAYLITSTTKAIATVEPRLSDSFDTLLSYFRDNELKCSREVYARGFTDALVHERCLLIYKGGAVVEFECYWPGYEHRGVPIASGVRNGTGDYKLRVRETWRPPVAPPLELLNAVLTKAKSIMSKYPADAGNS